MIYDMIWYDMYEGLGLTGHPRREKNCLHNPWVSSFITSMITAIRNVPNLNPPQHTTQLFWSIWILTTNLILWRKVWASVGLLEHEYGGLVENCYRYRSVPQSIVLLMCKWYSYLLNMKYVQYVYQSNYYSRVCLFLVWRDSGSSW